MEEAAAIRRRGPMRIFWRIMLRWWPRPGGDQRVRVHVRLERVHLRADVPRTDTAKYTMPIYVTYFTAAGGGTGGRSGTPPPVNTLPSPPPAPMVFFLMFSAADNGMMAGAVRGEPGHGQSGRRPVLGPPGRGDNKPALQGLSRRAGFARRVGRRLAGVPCSARTSRPPDSQCVLTAMLCDLAAPGEDPVIAIDEEGGDPSPGGVADGSPYPGNAASARGRRLSR